MIDWTARAPEHSFGLPKTQRRRNRFNRALVPVDSRGVYETVRAATAQPCPPGRSTTDGATRTTGCEDSPEHSMQRRQHRALALSLECGELQSQGYVLDGNGLVTAQQEPQEPNDG